MFADLLCQSVEQGVMAPAVFEQELPDMDHFVRQGAQQSHRVPVGALAAPKDEFPCCMIAVAMPAGCSDNLERHVLRCRHAPFDEGVGLGEEIICRRQTIGREA